MNAKEPGDRPEALGDILGRMAPKIRRARKAEKGRALAQKVLRNALGERHPTAAVASARLGVVVITTDSAAGFQELEGFERHKLQTAFRAAGLPIVEVRVKLSR